MMAPETENRIVKYLLCEASAEDLDTLSDWILIEGNERVFEEFVRSHYETTTAMNGPDTDKLKEVLRRRMKKDQNAFRCQKIRSLMKYAAAPRSVEPTSKSIVHLIPETEMALNPNLVQNPLD